MIMPDALLPSAFAELESCAQIWCLATETERWNKRLASTMPRAGGICSTRNAMQSWISGLLIR